MQRLNIDSRSFVVAFFPECDFNEAFDKTLHQSLPKTGANGHSKNQLSSTPSLAQAHHLQGNIVSQKLQKLQSD